jgi:hypothetical protein
MLNPDYIGTIKKFGDYYKLTVTRPTQQIKKDYVTFNQDQDKKTDKDNNERFENNISRAKNTILEIALCNQWDYFTTFTIDKKKYDRSNLKSYYKAFSQYIRNYRRKTGTIVDYLLVPELHKDLKSYHLHGLMKGLLLSDVVQHTNKRNANKGYLEFLPYTRKFGFNTFSKIENPLACSLYMQKYITKDVGKIALDKGQKLFYASQGLQRAEVITKAPITKPITTLDFDFQNDFVSCVFANNMEVLQTYF